MPALPELMVAPNGARRTKKDHPALPVTIEETVNCAIECRQAGADGLHAHVRNADQSHVLDAGMYRELLDECASKLPGFTVQVTTEAVGRYSPQQQAQLVWDLKPSMVSVALCEMTAYADDGFIKRFYRTTADEGISVQHILYTPQEIRYLSVLIEKGVVSANGLQLLFVLGRYEKNQQSEPGMLDAFIAAMNEHFDGVVKPDWACCAFGQAESDCLEYAYQCGGKMRVGFENSLWHRDGKFAKNNAERVTALVQATNCLGQ